MNTNIKGDFQICISVPLRIRGLEAKRQCFLIKKQVNLNKKETESKGENPIRTLRETNVCFSSYENRELKIKLRLIESRKRKRKRNLLWPKDILVVFPFCFNV